MQRQEPNLVGTVLDGRYKIVRKLGQGAMGTVFEGQHVSVGRRLAVKVLAQEYTSTVARERFFHEARAAGAISHPHIVPVQDFGFLDGGQPFMVMDFVEGETLEHAIEQRAPLSVEDSVEICCQVLSALEVIHGAGLVHRDIKPANIMLPRLRRPRVFTQLLDFGVSRAMHAMWHRPNLTQVNEVLGTPAYFSPEQAAGGEVDPRWDVWAVGVILYESLTGELPFRLESMAQVVSDLVNCRLIPLRRRNAALPEWLFQIQERVHHPIVHSRYATATAFLQALELRRAYLANEEIEAKTVPFLRVELDTPPPEILGQLSRPIQDYGSPGAAEARSTSHEIPSTRPQRSRQTERGYEDAVVTEREDEPEDPGPFTVPLRRSDREALTSDVQPVVEPRAQTRPGERMIWLPVVISLLLLTAAGVAVYLALSA